MNDTAWFLIGVAAGIAGTGAVMLARALHKALTSAATDLRTAIEDILDNPADLDDDDHIEDDVWDRDLRNLLHDSID